MALTIGQLKQQLNQFDPDTTITFGSSTFSKRPLEYYRCKWRGSSLHIETSETRRDDSNYPEYVHRITVHDLLSHIPADLPDDTRVEFGGTTDGSPLELESIAPAVSFNLIQRRTPNWIDRGL